MSEDEKWKISLINTASGRAALRGEVKKFGSLDARPNEKTILYDKFKSVMNGEARKKVLPREWWLIFLSGQKFLQKQVLSRIGLL